MSTTVRYPQLEEVTLRPPGTVAVPSQQRETVGGNAVERQKLQPAGPKPIRYFSVGRRTDAVICPICRGDTTVDDINKANYCDKASGWLCCLSCCFPIFALSWIYICCRVCSYTPRKFCSKCGAYLGFQRRPL